MPLQPSTAGGLFSHLRSASHLRTQPLAPVRLARAARPDRAAALALRGLQSRVSDSAMIDKPERRFPPPWSAEATDACFILRDANGQALARDEASHLQCICKVGHSP
jgi:hypothetical protein